MSLVYNDVYEVDFELTDGGGLCDTVELQKVMGRGVFGNVYGGVLRSSLDPVVVKILRPQLSGTQGETHFVAEALLHQKLLHPNIIPCRGMGTLPSGERLLVMEEAQWSLRDIMNGRRELSTKAKIKAVVDILAALEYLHGLGLAHNDVKPENILINDDDDDPDSPVYAHFQK